MVAQKYEMIPQRSQELNLNKLMRTRSERRNTSKSVERLGSKSTEKDSTKKAKNVVQATTVSAFTIPVVNKLFSPQ